MSQEKKNLTEEERKELKEGLKKKIDEMSDDELNKVAGGFEMWYPGWYTNWKFKFTEEEVKKLLTYGFKLEQDRVYDLGELTKIFNIKLIGVSSQKEVLEKVERALKNFGLSGCRV